MLISSGALVIHSMDTGLWTLYSSTVTVSGVFEIIQNSPTFFHGGMEHGWWARRAAGVTYSVGLSTNSYWPGGNVELTVSDLSKY